VGMTVPRSHNSDKAEARSCKPTTSAVTGVAIVQNTPLRAPVVSSSGERDDHGLWRRKS
jgi:hypothetical protein